MDTKKYFGKTARQWIVDMASASVRKHGWAAADAIDDACEAGIAAAPNSPAWAMYRLYESMSDDSFKRLCREVGK